MPARSRKTDGHTSEVRNTKKPVVNKFNGLTERTQKTVLETFTDEQVAEFRDLFSMFDKDNQGEDQRRVDCKVSLALHLKGCSPCQHWSTS